MEFPWDNETKGRKQGKTKPIDETKRSEMMQKML
jgi:hypothetical protein